MNFLPSYKHIFCYMPNYNYCVISTKHKNTNCSDWVIIRYKFFVQVWVVVNESCNKINFFFENKIQIILEHISWFKKIEPVENYLKIWLGVPYLKQHKKLRGLCEKSIQLELHKIICDTYFLSYLPGLEQVKYGLICLAQFVKFIS